MALFSMVPRRQLCQVTYLKVDPTGTCEAFNYSLWLGFAAASGQRNVVMNFSNTWSLTYKCCLNVTLELRALMTAHKTVV